MGLVNLGLAFQFSFVNIFSVSAQSIILGAVIQRLVRYYLGPGDCKGFRWLVEAQIVKY